MDRWYSHTPCGQEFAQILAQWVWNIRLELGQHLSQAELRTTEFAPAHEAETFPIDEPEAAPPPTVTYGAPQWARPSFTHGFPGSAFTLEPDGTLRCPANHPLYLQERRPERDGSLRLLYAARIAHCRSCPLRAQCQESGETIKPRRVSAVLWPLSTSPSDSSPPASASASLPSAPVLWRDWPRCDIRRTWMKLVAPPNHLSGKLCCVPIAGKSLSRKGLDPSGAGTLAAFLGTTPLSQCPSSGRSQIDRHTSWVASYLCLCLWLRSAHCSLTSTSRQSFCSLPQVLLI